MTIVAVRRDAKRLTMEGAASSINSRATAIKTILLAAWRAKLSNEDWETRIRKVLPKGVNGDVYDLADCLLKQALVGPVPNLLFISYLKHAVSTGLVSHGAVLSSISHQSTTIKAVGPNSSSPVRTSSLICLLEFLKSFRDKISCKGTETECLNLCSSLCQLIHWLLKCVEPPLDQVLGSTFYTTSQTTTSPPIAPSLSGVLASSATTSTTNPAFSTLPNPAASSLLSAGGANTSAGGNSSNNSHHDLILGIIDLCTEMIHYFIYRPFTKALLFISKIEYFTEFDLMLKTVQRIQQKLETCSNLMTIQEKAPHLKILNQLNLIFNSKDMHPSVVAAKQLKCSQQQRIRSSISNDRKNSIVTMQSPSVATTSSSSTTTTITIPTNAITLDSSLNYALFNSLYSLIAFDVVLRPARSLKLLARQIAIITSFNSATIDVTYCELIRVSMIGLIDTEGTPAKVKWAFFSYLKLPKLLLELSKAFKNIHTTTTQPTITPQDSPINPIDFINDLKLAFERLREYSPLLDEAEYKCNCDFFKCLVKELIKNDQSLIQLKLVEVPVKRISTSSNDSSVGGHLMLKTDPFVTSMLQTFNSEQDPVELFSLLSQFVSGKQFEFTLSCAASTGRLHMFVRKLVEYNELNRIPWNVDSNRNPQIQSLIFDITFLILTYIAQQYGPEVIGVDQQITFNRWFHDCYNPTTRVNCPNEMLKNSNPDVVNNIIKQFVPNEGSGVQMKSFDWRETSQNLPAAINEILNGWQQGHLTDDDMKGIVERIKSKMCFLAVITATWLQCHIRTVSELDKVRPLSLLQSLTKASQLAKQQKQQTTSEITGLKNESYAERSSLMCSIIRKIYFELVPKATSSSTNSSNNNSSSSNNNNNNTNSSSILTGQTNVYNQQPLPSATSSTNDLEDQLDETAYQLINEKFLSTLTTQEIFLINVKQCLNRGWIDHKSLNSLSSLFKIIGGDCFTNLLVEQILTSHESPSDLSRAVNITFGLFHLDIEACAFALLKDTIPSWLMGEKKQVLLNQPRAFALAHLAVMTIIEVYITLKNQLSAGSATNQKGSARDERKLPANGIKQEQPNQDDLGLNQAKRIKLTHSASDTCGNSNSSSSNSPPSSTTSAGSPPNSAKDVQERLDRLNSHIADLMRLFREIMSDTVMSQRTLFPVLFLQQTVVCTREGSTAITVHLQPEILLDIIDLFSSELTFELVLAISNLSTTGSRKYAAKAMCQLAQLRKE